jgi:hypothetical protein
MHGDGTLTAPFFVAPDSMFSPSATTRPPLTQLYVIINSKFSPEFKMTDRIIAGVLGRSIDLALSSALRVQVMVMNIAAQRLGIGLRVASLPASFDFPSRGVFDGKFMKALFEFGVEQGKKGSPFADMVPDQSQRRSNGAQ